MQLQLQALQTIKDMIEDGTMEFAFSEYKMPDGNPYIQDVELLVHQETVKQRLLEQVNLALSCAEAPLTEQEAHEFAFLTWNHWYDESSYHAGVKAGVEFAQRFHGIQPQ